MLTHELIRRRSVENGTPGLATEGLRSLSGVRLGKPGFSGPPGRAMLRRNINLMIGTSVSQLDVL